MPLTLTAQVSSFDAMFRLKARNALDHCSGLIVKLGIWALLLALYIR